MSKDEGTESKREETTKIIEEKISKNQIQDSSTNIPRFINSTLNPITRESKYIPGHGIKRYDNALKNLIPIRPRVESKGTMQIDSAGFFSFIYSTWLTKYLWRAYKRKVTLTDLPALSKFDSSYYNSQRLEILWNDELSKHGSEAASFPRIVWRFVRTRILVSCFLILCSQIVGFISNTLLMKRVLEHVNKPEATFWNGVQWVILLGLCDLVRVLLFSWSWMVNYRTAIRLKAACLMLLYKKIMNLNTLGNKSIGQLINIFSNDGQRASDVIVFGPMIVGGPVITICAVICILLWLSPIALLGIVVFLLFYPVQYIMSRLFSYYRRKTVEIADVRIESTNEVLNCIKIIKMYSWEEHFRNDILQLREKEKKWLWKTACSNSFSTALSPAVPILSIIVTFLAHVSMGNNLTAAVAFPVATFFSLSLKQGLIGIRDILRTLPEALISFNRFKSVLLLEDNSTHIIKPIIRSQALSIINGRFVCDVYDKDKEKKVDTKHGKKKFNGENGTTMSEKVMLNQITTDSRLEILSDITLEASKGQLIGICGHVGSGKTSLLIASLGQIKMTAGQLMRDGNCAYVSQEAWVINATLKENILFGEIYDHKRYQKALSLCSLKEDIRLLPDADETEIGERGVNVSGGQKQRIALARAYYLNRDIYFLDDPLSAVDANVGLEIFENLIINALAEKTVILVTHQVQFLNRCDDIYLLCSGRIIEHGTHSELMRLDKEYATMIRTMQLKIEEDHIQDESTDIQENNLEKQEYYENKSTTNANSDKKLNSQMPVDTDFDCQGENRFGRINKAAYHSYIMAAGGYFVLFMTICCFIIHAGIGLFTSWWLAMWIKAGGGNTTVDTSNKTIISDNISDNPDFVFYQSIYGSCVFVVILMCFVRGLVLRSAAVNASMNIHHKLINKLINAPIRFFDTIPSGRIQNLVSRDMEEVDIRLPAVLESGIQCIVSMILIFLTIICSLPWFIIPSIFLLVIFYYIGNVYRTGLTNLKRLESTLRSPVFSFVTVSAHGLSTIRAFAKEKDFLRKFQELLDHNNACYFMCDIAMRWLSSRFDSLATVCVCITAFIIISLKDQISPAIAGLALAYAVQLSGTFQYGLRMISDVEIRFVSVERIYHYIHKLFAEGDNKKISIHPPAEWPTAGAIQFDNVYLKYDHNSSHVALNNISFSVESGEKIGIVGRTGSGKSSLITALYRLYELSNGRILIDGVDISKIDLKLLRNQLTIIPQDPILFSGTIRYYLDPMKIYSDADIWNALERTYLKDKIALSHLQLDSPIGMGGKNFSMGERQLLCLARALLRHSKILMLDEATASVDPETEAAVHRTINEEFSKCTVLIIAHRLNAVLSCNRILVIDKGHLVEFDNPSVLLNNESSKFSAMFAAAEKATKND